MDIYLVTFCTMDQEVGANPLWHTCLLLSRYDLVTKKLEVVENWGFGGVPASSPYPFVRQLKKYLGLDTDFYGNHGMLYAEETRRLDRGFGLHGASFELTEEKFKLLQERCNKMVSDQNAAINEASLAFNLKPLEKFRNYPFEHESYRIYQYELQAAQNENRPSRLHEFSLNPMMQSRTCKVEVLSLLTGIITPEQLKQVTGWHPAVSRFSGPMENIYLHSSGPLFEYKKNSRDTVYSRQSKESKIYWTLPPQAIDTLSRDTRNLFKINEDHCSEIKNIIRKLQTLEWFFRNISLEKKYTAHRNQIIKHIINLYETFAVITPKKSLMQKNDWNSFWKWLASQPRDADEKILLEKLQEAKTFINHLYIAMVEKWDVDIIEHETEEINSDVDIEVLASYLSVKQQRELCQILGRNYLKPCDGGASLDSHVEAPTMVSCRQ